MSGLRLPRVVFFSILTMAVAQSVHDYSLLPIRLASHFGPSGTPNGWMTKPQFFAVYAVMILPALLVEFWVAKQIAKTDRARINLPNKEYWLAPERREATFAYFQVFFAWYGCAFLLLEVFAMGLALRANLASAPRLPSSSIIAALLVFLLFNLIGVVRMFQRFANPKHE